MLYKYLDLPRIDILQNSLIRFTQPGAFNDPFELKPSFDLMSKKDISAMNEAIKKNCSTDEERKAKTAEELNKMLTTLAMGINRVTEKIENPVGCYSLNNNEIASSVFDSKYGILSLTNDPNNLLMWSHYADNHRGFVLQFDENHDFFKTSYFDNQEFSLTKVEYSSERPVLSYSNLHSPEVYYRKSPCWSYEQELRLIKPLSEASKIIEDHVYPIALFELPIEAVRGIIIGVNVSNLDRNNIFELLQQPRYKHITIFQTRCCNDSYELEINPSIDGSPYSGELKGKACEAR